MGRAAAARVLAISLATWWSAPAAALKTLAGDTSGGTERRRGQTFYHDESGDAFAREQRHAGDQQHHHGHTQAAFTCRERLHRDGECCVDNNYGEPVEGVRHTRIRRPNTTWSCDDDWCYDDLGGERGEDIIWWPEGAGCSSPRILYVHGGAWYFGSPNTTGYGTFGAKLAKAAFATVMVIDYPLAPKHHWKQMAHFTLRALEYLATTGRPGCTNKPGHGPPLLLGGDSSGGGLAYSVLMALTRSGSRLNLNQGADKVAGAFFFSPWMNLKCNTPTYASNVYSNVTLTGRAIPPSIQRELYSPAPPPPPVRRGHDSEEEEPEPEEGEGVTWHLGDVLFPTRKGYQIKECLQNAEDYVGETELLESPLVSPIWAYPRMHGGMPPLLLSVGASEVLLGDVIMSAQIAAAGGVEVVMDVYDGMWHDFQMYSEGCGGRQELWEGVLSIHRTARFIKDIVHTGHPPCGKGVLGVPRTTWHMTRPGTNADWVPGNGNPDRFMCPPTYKDTMVPEVKNASRVVTKSAMSAQDILANDAHRAAIAHPNGASAPPNASAAAARRSVSAHHAAAPPATWGAQSRTRGG